MSLMTSFLRASRTVVAPTVLAAALVSASSRALSFALKTLSGGFGLGKLGLFAMASWTALPAVRGSCGGLGLGKLWLFACASWTALATVRSSFGDLGRKRTAMGPLNAVLDFIMPPID